MLARFHRALSRDCKVKLGSLLAPSGRCTQSEGETLELLLVTHFPKLVVTEDVAAPATDVCTKLFRLAGRLGGLSLIGEWNGQLILLPHTKVQDWMGYSQPSCKRDGELLSLTWLRSVVPAW